MADVFPAAPPQPGLDAPARTAQIDYAPSDPASVGQAAITPPTPATVTPPNAAPDQVTQLYRTALGRAPDAAGLASWSDELQSGAMTLQQEAVCFLSSDEFRSAYGVLDDAAFVGQMFQNGLGRAADPAGAIYWTQQVAGGVEARAGLVLALNASPEHQAHATALMVQSP